jgi:hypothetical protein
MTHNMSGEQMRDESIGIMNSADGRPAVVYQNNPAHYSRTIIDADAFEHVSFIYVNDKLFYSRDVDGQPQPTVKGLLPPMQDNMSVATLALRVRQNHQERG